MMGDTPTTGEVKVVLQLDTAEAKAKADEVERRLKQNQKEVKTTAEKSKRNLQIDKKDSYVRPNTPFFRSLRDEFRKNGGPSGNASAGDILWALGGYKMEDKAPKLPPSPFMGLRDKLIEAVNPFPKGGISAENVGKAAPTIGLAAAIYTALDKAATFGGEGLAYAMKSGAAAAQTPAGQFFNNLQSTFSYINNYAGSYRDAATRLAEWDDAVAAVTGKLPDTQFYFPKFQRLAAAERQFQEMVKRNAAWTKAGAMGNSSVADQLGDVLAHSISR